MNHTKPLLLLTAGVSFLTAIMLLITNIVLWSKYSDACDLLLASAPAVGKSYATTCKDEAQVKRARELLERLLEDTRIKGWDDYILWATPVKQKFYKKALETFEKNVPSEICKETPYILERGLSMKDKTLLSCLRTTTLKNIEIQSPGLTGAMDLLNKHIVGELGYPNGVSYTVQSHETKSVISDPFDSSKVGTHGVGNSVSIQMTSASVEEVLTRIASQTGYKVRLSNGIIFY